jgi:7,8-dihydropterin-6-yl-methyl-4-(beta-D-ribofuranosyl)aminobenzene 5'-phosphate synthase
VLKARPIQTMKRVRNLDGAARWRWLSLAGVAAAVGLFAPACTVEQEIATSPPASEAKEGTIVMTIVYDNNPGPKELTAAWGFACVIRGTEKTILFDTGGDGPILLENMRQLNLDPEKIDIVVLSHIHGDHTGGLSSFLQVRTGVPVYMPVGFPSTFRERVRSLGAYPEEAADSAVICDGVRTTGTLGIGAIEEHGLCVKIREGWVLVTGCAHPGIADMVARAKQITDGPIHLVMGGFHLGPQPRREINALIDRFEELGVVRVAPCHCSGEPARRLFQERFGERCTLAGVGTVLRFPPDEQE